MTHTPTGIAGGEWGVQNSLFQLRARARVHGRQAWSFDATFSKVNYIITLRLLWIFSIHAINATLHAHMNANDHVSGENTCDASRTLFGVFIKSSEESGFVGV